MTRPFRIDGAPGGIAYGDALVIVAFCATNINPRRSGGRGAQIFEVHEHGPLGARFDKVLDRE